MREIFKAFTKTVSGTAISLVIGSLSVKIIASIIGPSGMGLYSILRQIHSTTLIAATMGGQTALVQGGASRQDDDRAAYLKTVLILFIISAALFSILLFVLAPTLSLHLLNRQDEMAVTLIRGLAIPVFLTVITGYVSGVLNIHRALGYMALVQTLASVVTLALSYPVAMAVKSGYDLALVGIMTAAQATSLGLFGFWLWRNKYLQPLLHNLRNSFDKVSARYFFSFAGVTVVTSLFQSIIMLGVRGIIVQKHSLAEAGIFDAAWTLCGTYISLITGAFSTYYLPTLSQLEDRQLIRDMIERTLLFIAIISTVVIVGMICLKQQIVTLLFSRDFIPSLSLIRWLLIADFLKMLSFVLAFPMLAFKHLKIFFWTEIFWNAAILSGCYWSLTRLDSLEGIGISVLACYLTYLIFTLWFVWDKYKFLPSITTASVSLTGFLFVLAASAYTWNFI
ncbi:MAG: oligosaccharide flippase family protein [Aphanizomenon gracile PMC627.10]|nr:oligosaccharide flippase family protein [Aphanizomenon gracile PMC627.10]